MSRVKEFASAHPKLTFFLLLLVAILLCVAASILIKTDREKVNDVIRSTAVALEEDDADAVMSHVARDFRQEGMDHAGLRVFVRQGLHGHGPPSILILRRDYELVADAATCELGMIVSFPKDSMLKGFHSKQTWQVKLKKVEGAWFITQVTPIDIDGFKLAGLLDLPRRPAGYR